MANNIKQVMDIRPGKGMTTGQSDEHQRNWTERGWERASKHGNYDRTRERLNFEVIKGGKVVPVDKSKSIPDRMAETLRERSIKDPNAGLTEPKFRTVSYMLFLQLAAAFAVSAFCPSGAKCVLGYVLEALPSGRASPS